MKTSFLHETFQLQHCKTTFLLPDIPGVLLKTSCTLISVYVDYVGKEWSTLTQNFEIKTWYNVEISTTAF